MVEVITIGLNLKFQKRIYTVKSELVKQCIRIFQQVIQFVIECDANVLLFGGLRV